MVGLGEKLFNYKLFNFVNKITELITAVNYHHHLIKPRPFYQQKRNEGVNYRIRMSKKDAHTLKYTARCY